MKLRQEQKDDIKVLIQRLGICQAELARYSKIKPSVLCEVLKSDKNKGLRCDTWQRLENALEKLIFEFQLNMDGDVLERFRRSIQRPVNDRLLMQVPHGPLGSCVNYVERSCDQKLRKIIDEIISPITFVSSGIQTGKSSLILRFIRTARFKRHQTIYIDCESLTLALSKGESFIGLFLETLIKEIEALFQPQTTTPKYSFDIDHSSIQQALEVLETSLQQYYSVHPDKKIFVVIDSIDNLFNKVSDANINRFISFLIFWSNKIQTYDVYCKPLFLIVASAIQNGPVEPLLDQSWIIKVPFFTTPELVELFAFWQIWQIQKPSEEDLVQLMNLFGGQPYLTHLFLFSRKREIILDKLSLKDILKKPDLFSSEYLSKYW